MCLCRHECQEASEKKCCLFHDTGVSDGVAVGSVDSSGISLIFRIIFLSAVNTHHNRQRKKTKKMTNDMTGQMAMLSML